MRFLIKNIRLKDLNDYIDSEEFNISSFIPISRIRARSHLRNPRASQNDYCLFLAYYQDRLVGYLGALTDTVFFGNNLKEKVFWLSCMWVLPEYRRHGVALDLLKHAYKVFEGKVLITNFIPRSKSAFDKTGQYLSLPDLQGIRGYCLFDFATILPRKNKKNIKLKPLLKAMDYTVNLLLRTRHYFAVQGKTTRLKYIEVQVWDNAINDFLETNVQGHAFKRDGALMKWIKDYPWIKQVDEISFESKRYWFSDESKSFKQWFVKIEDNNKVVGFLAMTYFKNELKIPYLILKESSLFEDVALYIHRIIYQYRIRTLVSFYPFLNNSMIKRKVFFCTRKSSHGFLIGKELGNVVKGGLNLQPGDGDGVFT